MFVVETPRVNYLFASLEGAQRFSSPEETPVPFDPDVHGFSPTGIGSKILEPAGPLPHPPEVISAIMRWSSDHARHYEIDF